MLQSKPFRLCGDVSLNGYFTHKFKFSHNSHTLMSFPNLSKAALDPHVYCMCFILFFKYLICSTEQRKSYWFKWQIF